MDPKLVEGEAARVVKDIDSVATSYIEEAKKQHQNQEASIIIEGKDEAPENQKEEASGKSVAAEAKNDDKNKFGDAILVVATLITTLTYQALLNPPSTLYNQGTEIDWGCLGKNPGRGLIKGMKECPAGLTFAFLFINTIIFLNSILILVLTLHAGGQTLLNPFEFLLGSLIINLTVNYCILLMAFSHYTAYVAIPLCCVAFLVFSGLMWYGWMKKQLWEYVEEEMEKDAKKEKERKLEGNTGAPKSKAKPGWITKALMKLEEYLLKEMTKAKDAVYEKKMPEEAILVVATLIITLTYQALLNPPSTLFKTEIEWGCLGKHHKHGLIKGMKECPAGLAFAFLFFNTITFIDCVSLVTRTLRGYRYLLGALIIFLMVCYCILLMAFSYYTAYVAIPLCFLVLVDLLFFEKELAVLKWIVQKSDKFMSSLVRKATRR